MTDRTDWPIKIAFLFTLSLFIYLMMGPIPFIYLESEFFVFWLCFSVAAFAVTQSMILTFSLVRYRQGHQIRDMFFFLLSFDLLLIAFAYLTTHPVFSSILPLIAFREKNRTFIVYLTLLESIGFAIASSKPYAKIRSKQAIAFFIVCGVLVPILCVLTLLVPEFVIITSIPGSGMTTAGIIVAVLGTIAISIAGFRFLRDWRTTQDKIALASGLAVINWVGALLAFPLQSSPFQIIEIVWFTLLTGGFIYIMLAMMIDVVLEPHKILESIITIRNKEIAISEAKYRALIEYSLQGILILESEPLRIIFANNGMSNLLGYSVSELLEFDSKGIDEIIHIDDRETFHDNLREVLEGRIFYPTELQLIRKTSEIVIVEAILASIDFEDEKVVQATFNDITQRHEVMEALYASEQQLDMALYGADLGIWDWDIATNTMLVDWRYAEILGYELGEIKNDYDGWLELIHPDDIDSMKENWQSHVEGNVSLYSSQHRMKRKTGEYIWILERGRILEAAPDGEPERAAGTILDISLIRQAQDQTERAAEIMKLYLDLMGHDITNMLQALLSGLEIMQMLYSEIDSVDIIESMVESIRACNDLIQSIYRTDGLLTTPMMEISFKTEVEKSVYFIQSEFKETTIEIDMLEFPAHIIADSYIQVMIVNLLNNAIIHNSSATKQVWVSLKESKGGYLLTIADNGRGITHERKESLFDPNRRFGGIGVHQARQIVQKYQGWIDVVDRVKDKPHLGASFRVWIPKP